MQHNKEERTQFFRKIYHSLYLKGFESITKYFTVWEVSWRLNRTATYWPPILWPWQLFFPVLLGCSTGHGPHSSIFTPTDLNFLSLGLYNNLTSTFFLRASQFCTQFNASTFKVAPDFLISSTGCTCYLHRSISSFDGLAGSKVNMQHIYILDIWFLNTFCR